MEAMHHFSSTRSERPAVSPSCVDASFALLVALFVCGSLVVLLLCLTYFSSNRLDRFVYCAADVVRKLASKKQEGEL